MPLLGFELDFDELVAIILAVICTVSVLLTILQPIFAWFLRHSCLHAVLLQMDVYTELRAEQAALARARKPKVSKYGAEEAAKLTSVEVVPTRTTPTKMTAIAAKAAKASPSPEKASAEKKKDSKPMTVQERRAARATALHGEAAGKVAGNAHELLVAEAGADKAKTFDQKTGMAVMGAPRQPAKQPRAGVRGRGRATLVYPGDGVYEGEYKDGLKDGKGRFFYVVGSVYDGQWKEDQKHGEGKETYADGAVYDGLFVAGTRHGRGTLQYANSDSYEGEWSLDMKHGTGTFRWGAGTVYEGDFREGVMHGSGTYYFADGCVSATLRRAAPRSSQLSTLVSRGLLCLSCELRVSAVRVRCSFRVCPAARALAACARFLSSSAVVTFCCLSPLPFTDVPRRVLRRQAARPRRLPIPRRLSFRGRVQPRRRGGARHLYICRRLDGGRQVGRRLASWRGDTLLARSQARVEAYGWAHHWAGACSPMHACCPPATRGLVAHTHTHTHTHTVRQSYRSCFSHTRQARAHFVCRGCIPLGKLVCSHQPSHTCSGLPGRCRRHWADGLQAKAVGACSRTRTRVA